MVLPSGGTPVKVNWTVVGDILSTEYEKGEEGFTADRGT
jgi:hypothetical protein